MCSSVNESVRACRPAWTSEEKEFKPIGAIKIEYDIARGSYSGLHNHLHQVLATSRTVDGIPVLVAQMLPRSPPKWIIITRGGAQAPYRR